MEDKNELLDVFKELITGKDNKTKSYDKISSIVDELFISDSTSPKTIKKATDIILEADTSVVEAFFGVNWGNLSVDNKNLILKVLLSVTNEKRVLRQAIAAQSIADLDKESASKLVFHIINDGKEKLDKEKLPSPVKYKEDFLRRFFFSPETKWISFESSNEEILKGLILYFVGLANNENNFGTGKSILFPLNFARWVIRTLNKINLSSESTEFVERYLVKLLNKLPDKAKIELQELWDKNKDNSEQSIVKEKTAGSFRTDETSNNQKIVDKSETIPAQVNKIPAQVNKKREQYNKQKQIKADNKTTANKDTQTSKDKTESTAENLLEEKQKRFAQLDLEIKVLTDLISERDGLRNETKFIKQKLDSANDELEVSEDKIKSFRNKVEELDNNLRVTTKERDDIFNSEKELSNQLLETRKNLESKTKIIEDIRSKFSEKSKRKIHNELESFKSKLRQKLHPVFENKRQTDDNSDSEKLSGFLRRCFNQIEGILEDLDIKP